MQQHVKQNIAVLLLLMGGILQSPAQSVELYAGHKRAGTDILWFKRFNSANNTSPFIFFSRNRASVDYHQSPTIFSSTHAVSYNNKKGLGWVLVASMLNNSITAKTGLQYVKISSKWMMFGWLVADLKKKGNVDLFVLMRYQPGLTKHTKLFSQAELFPVYQPSTGNWNLTQRARLGIRYKTFVMGAMADFNQAGHHVFTTTINAGAFVRYDF